jgi:hypothetical protein
MEKEQLLSFIKRRNESLFQSNLQFQIDAECSGFKVEELGKPEKISEYEYIWHTKFGRLLESFGKLSLE